MLTRSSGRAISAERRRKKLPGAKLGHRPNERRAAVGCTRRGTRLVPPLFD